jgi:hypothetical protein
MTPDTRIGVNTADVEWLVKEVIARTKTKGQGVALLLSAYTIICEQFEPKMSRQEAAANARAAVHSFRFESSKNDSGTMNG